jgi:exodeoxyribonuclease V alpha subunit
VAAADQTLEGTVERVTFYNPENGFSVVKLRLRGRRAPVAAVGTLPEVQPGEGLRLEGAWQTDPRHGAQFRIERATVRPPSELDDLVRYLGSGRVRQLGPVLARRIVETFGQRTLEVLEQQPERVREVPGIGSLRARALAAAWREQQSLRAVARFLSEHRIDTRYAARLVQTYGADAPRVLAANPYRLVADVPGIGFATADRLGRDLGVRPGALPRLQAAVHAALLRAGEQGHTRLSREQLVAQAAALASVAPDDVAGPVEQLLANGTIAATTAARPTSQAAPLAAAASDGRLRLYAPPAAAQDEGGAGLGLAGLVRAEESLAAGVRTLVARRADADAGKVDAWLAADPEARRLSDEQRQAVRGALTHGLFILTGGPGVGKTTALRAAVACLRALGVDVALAAPTGKAAKRLAEVTGVPARTIHRLLGAGPRGFRHGAEDPLPHGAVVVDEASMLDTSLARAVVAAIGRRGRLILVGDADQLPSVGPGQVLRDLLDSGVVPSARLTEIFRQAARSRIVTNAHRVRSGEPPELEAPTAFAQGVDCLFVPAGPEQAPAVAAEWAASRLPRLTGLPSSEVQVLAPLTRICQAVNGLLQERLNPARGQDERPHGALPLRVGDRVIQTRNNYGLGVFNGDTGTVVAVTPGGASVDFGEGQVIEYQAADLLELDHAYGLTVHRAQGSEWPAVVLLASSSYGPMLSRNLLYTGLTRAKQALLIVGDQAALRRAAADTRELSRQTGLAALLTGRAGPNAQPLADAASGRGALAATEGQR